MELLENHPSVGRVAIMVSFIHSLHVFFSHVGQYGEKNHQVIGTIDLPSATGGTVNK